MNPARRIRVSDAEREAVVARLSAAAAEGRLTLAEFGDRSHRAYASRTHDELAVLLADLPDPAVQRPSASGSPVPTLALVFGGASIPLSLCVPFGFLLAVAGIVLGVVGVRGAGGHRASAVAGAVCGAIGILLQVLVVVFVVTVD